MADFKIGKNTTHREKDALQVSNRFQQMQAFARVAANPRQKEEFLAGLKMRQEQSLVSGNKTMFELVSNMIKATEDYIPDNKQTGSRFDSSQLYS